MAVASVSDITWTMWAGSVGLASPIPSRVEAAHAGGFTRISLGPLELVQGAGGSPAELGRYLRGEGLEVVLDPVLGWYGDIGEPHRYPAYPRDDVLRMSEAVGAVSVNLIGPYGTAIPWDRVTACFAELCDRARDIGAAVHLEFYPMSAVVDIATAWSVVEAAGRENGGLLFDTWHFFRGNPDYATLARIPGERIFAVQVSDAAAAVDGELGADTLRRKIPGDGDLDLSGALAALDAIGGLRVVGPEVLSPETEAMDPAEVGRLTGRRLRELVADVRSRARAEPTG